MAKNKELEAVVSFVGNIDPSLSKAVEGAKKQLGGINLKAIAAGAAVGGIAVATGKAVAGAAGYLKDLGAEFDEAFDAIRVGTGATGDDLAALEDDFKAVYSSVPTTMEDASKAIADYNTRLGLTGDTLQGISGQAIQVADLLGEDVYRRLKIQGAGGLQKLADGSQVQRSQDPPCRRLFGDGDGRGDYLFHRLSHAFELLSVGAEGVGAENLGSRLHIGAMNLQKPARVFQCGQLRMFAQSQSLGLEHGAHAAV